MGNLANFRKTSLLQKTVMGFIGGLLTSEEELEAMKSQFNAMDSNNNGLLDMDELKEGMRDQMDALYFDQFDWEEWLKTIDTDGDGQVNFTEFITAANNRKKMLNEKNLKTAFSIFDADGDGSITKDEL